MGDAELRVHGELIELLPHVRSADPAVRTVADGRSVKDAIESAGVPHTEVDLVVAGGRPVGWAYRVQAGDEIDAYGFDRPPGLAELPGLAPATPLQPRFVVDGHLGRLARYLRLLGLDTWYSPRAGDAELARVSADETRILLSRDRGLLKRSIVRYGRLVRNDDPRAQLAEIVSRFRLAPLVAPFTRCIRCNGAIVAVAKADVAERLRDEPRTLRYFDTFGRCLECGAIYWGGSHYDRMRRLVEAIVTPTDRTSDGDGTRGAIG